MKKRGYSLEFLLFALGIITFIIVIIVILFQDKPKEEMNYTYKDMEFSLVTSTKNYLKGEYKSQIDDGSMIISMKELSDKGYYSKEYDPYNKDNICEGYVLVEIFGGVGFYESFVKCGTNYITDGYK